MPKKSSTRQSRTPDHCEWQYRAHHYCASLPTVYDVTWERWLCPSHFEQSFTNLWGFPPPVDLPVEAAA